MYAWRRIAALNTSAKRSRVASLNAVAWSRSVGVRPQRGARLTQLQEGLCRVAHQCHEDVPVPAALATTAAPDFFQLLLEALGVVRERRGSGGGDVGSCVPQLERFFCAFYRVVASVTRWLLVHTEGVDDERGGADKTFVHRRRRVESDQLIHEGLVNAAAKLATRLG